LDDAQQLLVLLVHLTRGCSLPTSEASPVPGIKTLERWLYFGPPQHRRTKRWWRCGIGPRCVLNSTWVVEHVIIPDVGFGMKHAVLAEKSVTYLRLQDRT
jgi:hypothetical protein